MSAAVIIAIFTPDPEKFAPARHAQRIKGRSFHKGNELPGMFSLSIIGAILIAATCAAFWRLLPRNGQEHPLVRNSDVGSMITIGMMTVLTVGVAMLLEGLSG
jgi:hypothetical protein